MGKYYSRFEGEQIDDAVALFANKGLNLVVGLVQRNADGSFSVKAVETTLTDTNDRLPTSKAVKTYVDSNGGKIDTIKVNGTTQAITNKSVDLNVQEPLVSGTNIKTVNNQSIVGSGNLDIGGDAAAVTVTLSKDGWVNKTQAVAVQDMTPTKNVFVSAVLADADAYEEAGVLCTGQSTNSLLFTCQTVPTKDIRASLLLLDTDTALPAIPTNTSDLVNDGDGQSAFATLNDLDDYNGFVAVFGTTTYTEINAALTAGKIITISEVPYESDVITISINWSEVTFNDITMKGTASSRGGMWDTSVIVTNLNEWSVLFENTSPFMLYDFSKTISIDIPSCQSNVINVNIPNMDITISDELGQNWAIASLAKYEVYDSSSGGNRINCWPVCSFSMDGQKTLRLRMMCGGTSAKTAKRVQGAILLKHR